MVSWTWLLSQALPVATILSFAPPTSSSSRAITLEQISNAASYFSGLETRPIDESEAGLQACGMSRDCFADLARKGSFAWILVVLVNDAVSPSLVAAQVYDPTGVRRATAVREQPSRAFVVGDAVRAALLKAGLTEYGKVHFESPAGGSLTWSRTVSNLDANTVLASPGAITVDAQVPGFVRSSTGTWVRAGMTQALSFGDLRPEDTSSFPWLWVGTGVVVVGTVVGIAISSASQCLCVGAKDGNECRGCP